MIHDTPLTIAADFFVLVTYGIQIVLVCFFPVPSAGSTAEMLFKAKTKNPLYVNHPAKSVLQSPLKKFIVIAATLWELITFILPVAVFLNPKIERHLFPLVEGPSVLLDAAGILLLGFGNLLTLLAVKTLKTHVTFHDFGETKKLYTVGIYGCIRNPIIVGLAAIYTGLVLWLPSGVMLAGFGAFLLNSHYRVKMEESYLEQSFGRAFLRYKNSVGRYLPKVKKKTGAPFKA